MAQVRLPAALHGRLKPCLKVCVTSPAPEHKPCRAWPLPSVSGLLRRLQSIWRCHLGRLLAGQPLPLPPPGHLSSKLQSTTHLHTMAPAAAACAGWAAMRASGGHTWAGCFGRTGASRVCRSTCSLQPWLHKVRRGPCRSSVAAHDHVPPRPPPPPPILQTLGLLVLRWPEAWSWSALEVRI